MFKTPIFIQIAPINVLDAVFIWVEMFMPALVPEHARNFKKNKQKNALVLYYKWKN